MTKVKNPDHCLVCGAPLEEDYESVKVPGSFTIHPTMTSDPGVYELRFCCERHRRDWSETRHGQWHSDEEED